MGSRCQEQLEELKRSGRLRTFLLAYMRDVTYTMDPAIQCLNPEPQVIGRAFTVKGPDIYFNALEAIPEGSIYVHAHTSNDHAVWAGPYAEMYGRDRGLVAAVIDGGIHDRKMTVECEMPTFARFVTPKPAINREKGIIQVPVVCGGVPVCPGDLIVGDADGVVVIPQGNEQDISDNLDSFLEGIAMFGKVARQPGVVITQHEALKEMVQLKYQHPYDYWRYYEPWAAKWREKYGAE